MDPRDLMAQSRGANANNNIAAPEGVPITLRVNGKEHRLQLSVKNFSWTLSCPMYLKLDCKVLLIILLRTISRPDQFSTITSLAWLASNGATSPHHFDACRTLRCKTLPHGAS